MSCPLCKQDKIEISKRRWADGKFDYWCPSCGHQVPEPDAVAEAGPVVLYDKMVLAINECHRTDEVKEIRDRALALQECARIAKNFEAERKAGEIRIRAERRTGELLSEMEKGKGGRPPENSAQPALSLFAKAKQDAEISDDQAKRWQQLADIPKEEFEQALSDPDEKPSTSGLITKVKPSPSLKPIIDLPPPPKLDDNPRYCHASCCNGETEIRGQWSEHEAQSLLDAKGFPSGFFGKNHSAILAFGVECHQARLLSQLKGELPDSALLGKERRYRGIGQERN
jgi:hypothetical protein